MSKLTLKQKHSLRKKINIVTDALMESKKAKVNKITHQLIKLDKVAATVADDKRNVLGYCAVGWLGCRKNMFAGLTQHEADNIDEDDVVRQYGFTDKEMRYMFSSPLLTEKPFAYDVGFQIDELIWNLNDNEEDMSIYEIGKQLKKNLWVRKEIEDKWEKV